MSKQPEGATNCQRQRRSADMDLTLQESKHTRASEQRSARTSAQTNRTQTRAHRHPARRRSPNAAAHRRHNRTPTTPERNAPPGAKDLGPRYASLTKAAASPAGRRPRTPPHSPYASRNENQHKANAAGKNGNRGTTSQKTPPPPRPAQTTRGRPAPSHGGGLVPAP